ncbi:MAG: hypothetical protein JTJ21_08330 [Holdemanella sp.]|nr:hypothetical protein [Holdemanella sp.]
MKEYNLGADIEYIVRYSISALDGDEKSNRRAVINLNSEKQLKNELTEDEKFKVTKEIVNKGYLNVDDIRKLNNWGRDKAKALFDMICEKEELTPLEIVAKKISVERYAKVNHLDFSKYKDKD